MKPTPFMRMPLRSSGDLLRARQRTRQVAQLLGYAPRDVLVIATRTFLAAHAGSRLGPCELQFWIARGELTIRVASQRPDAAAETLALTRPLPRNENQLSMEDLLFVLRQMDGLARGSALSELNRVHEEMLGLLSALHDCQTHIETQRHPSAA